ncbi:MAG: hypothetical protein ACYC5O_18720 [Anaerolineae bacterium]
MVRGWLSWLGGMAIVIALVLIVLAAHNMALAAEAGPSERANGDRFAGVHAPSTDWGRLTDAAEHTRPEWPALPLTQPLPAVSVPDAPGSA